MSAAAVIEVNGLCRVYGTKVAVADLSFAVNEGEIFGILGPNGAGKSTTIETLVGLRSPSRGSVKVLGLDPLSQGSALRTLIGVQLQESGLPDRMRVEDALELYQSFYPQTIAYETLLTELGLTEKRKTPFSQLSGGQKQRLFIALALLHDPQVLFLDELSTGLDPQARRTIWELIRTIRGRHKTVLLSTHLMEEAEALCDRVAILHQGRIAALGTPAAIVREYAPGYQISFAPLGPIDMGKLAALPEADRAESQGDRVTVIGHSEHVIAAVTAYLHTAGMPYHDVAIHMPTLEDAYLRLIDGARA